MPDIVFNPVPDSSYRFAILSERQTIQEVDSRKMMSTSFKYDVRIRLLFKKRENNSFPAFVYFDSFTVETAFRSADDKVTDSSNFMWPTVLKDAKLALTVDSIGRIKTLNGYDSLARMLEKIQPSQQGDSENNLTQIFTQQRLEEIILKLFAGYAADLSTSDRWEKDEVINISHPFSIRVQYASKLLNPSIILSDGKSDINKVSPDNSDETKWTGIFENVFEINPISGMMVKGDREVQLTGLTNANGRNFSTRLIDNVQIAAVN